MASRSAALYGSTTAIESGSRYLHAGTGALVPGPEQFCKSFQTKENNVRKFHARK